MKYRVVLVAVVVAVAAGVIRVPAQAQELMVGGSHFSTSRADLPGGPGAWLRFAWAPFTVIRLEAGVSRDWGEKTSSRVFCDIEWPEAIGCSTENVRRDNDVTGLEAGAGLISPQFAGFRVGVVGGLAHYEFRVVDTGLTTGRNRRPLQPRGGDPTSSSTPTAALLLEYSPPVLSRLTVEARGQRASLDLGDCMMDAWSICGDATLRRLSLGASYRF
jgi:hypothetical protein